MNKFDNLVEKIAFMPRDSTKIVLSGQNLFKMFQNQNKKLIEISEYEDLPLRYNETQNFRSFCYTEREQLIGCSSSGDIFVCELMSVVETIDSSKLVAPGTSEGSRLQFQQVVSNKFGFLVASPDVLYFFKFIPTPDLSERKGHHVCILKWRAPVLQDTTITSISVEEGPEETDSNLVVSTKNNQIISKMTTPGICKEDVDKGPAGKCGASSCDQFL